MFRKRMIAALLLLVLAALLPAGCQAQETAASGVPGGENWGVPAAPAVPEHGTWHAEVLFSSLDGELPWYARIPLAIALGNTAFEVDVEIADDGTFTYETNTETLKKSAAGATNTLIGLFLKDIDLSRFIDNAAEAILPETVMGKDRDCYGTYERAADGLLTVTTTEGDLLYFKAFGKKLVQMDETGKQVLTFQRP